MALNEFLLSEDVAAILGVSRSTVQEWIKRGRLPHRKLPGTRRCFIPTADFNAWMDGAELENEQLLGDGGRIVRPRKASQSAQGGSRRRAHAREGRS